MLKPRLLTFSLRRPRLALAVAIGVTALLSAQLPKLRRDVRQEKIFPERDPSRQIYEAFKETFGPDNRTALCVVELEGDVLAVEHLERVYAWTEELDQEPLVDRERLTSLTHAPLLRVVGDDDLDPGPLYEPKRAEAWDRDAIDRQLREHPAFQGRLLSADRRLATLLVPITPDADNLKGRGAFVARLRAFFAERLRPGEQVYLDGFAVSEIELHRLIGEDSVRFAPLATLAVLLGLWLTLRRVRLVAAAAAVAVTSVVWTLGLMAVLDIPISFLSAVIPVMILVVTVGDSIYLTTRFFQRLVAGDPRDEALHTAVTEVGGACLMTSLTTAIGFFSLALSDVEIIRELGIPVGIGVLSAYVATLLLLPPLLDRMAVSKPEEVGGALRPLRKPLARVARLVTTRPGAVLAATSLVVIGAAMLAPRVPIRSRLLDDLDPDQSLVKNRLTLERRMSGVAPVELVVRSEREDRMLDPDVQAGLLALTERARGERYREMGVLFALSSPDFLLDVHHAWLGRQPGTRTLPSKASTNAQLLLVYDSVEPNPIKDYLSFDRREARLALRVENRYTEDLFRLAEVLEEDAKELLPADVQVGVTGRALVAQSIHRSLVRGVAESLAVAVVAVLLLMLLFLRSLRLALLTLVPNLLPLLLVLGFMGATGIALAISTSVIFTIAFGIAIDDTVHFLTALHHQRAAGDRDDVATTVRQHGAALCLTTLVLAMGFLVLLASNFPVNRYFGSLVALTLVFALACDLLVLPALLSVTKRASVEP